MEKMDSGQSIYLDLSISRQNENGEAVSGCASAGDNDSTERMDRMEWTRKIIARMRWALIIISVTVEIQFRTAVIMSTKR